MNAASNDSNALVFDHVTKQYGPVLAVDDVSFSIPRGTLVTLLGPSGCGKTSTLRLIAGLESVSRGRILIGGSDVTQQSAVERKVSMVFQSYALFPHMSVIENVAYGLEVGGLRKADARAQAAEGLRLVGLVDYGARLPSELSGGQQQRVAVARALVLKPQVLLLDEPLSNLDTKLRRRVRDEIREIQQSLQLTAVYVTHDQEEALAVSDQIIVMNHQRIAQHGSPRDLFETPADEFIADFICDANMVSGEVRGAVVDGKVECRLGGAVLRLPNRHGYRGDVRVAVRPDAVLLAPAAANDPLVGRVVHAAFLGTEMQYTVASPLGELFVRQAEVLTPLPVGGAVAIRFPGHGVSIVGGCA
jgi:iron(III) transport system ATP-binding protein